MSLLNQVLQDLEKRNTENAPEQLKLSNVKAIISNQRRSYYLPFVILCIIAIIIFSAQKTTGTVEQQNISKQSVAIQTSTNTIKTTPPKQPSVPETAHSVHKAQAKKTSQSDKQQIKSEHIARQELPTEIKTRQKTIRKKPKDKTVKKLSDKQKAEHYFSLAKKQQSTGDKQKNLELAIQLNPQHVNARLQLTNTLLQQGLTLQSAELLDQSLELFPQNLQFITLRSQLFLQKKQAQDALNILHHIDENHVQNETYLSLLAAAYQQNNDNLNSLKTYQKLLNINSQRPEYWLGLAIALEKQEHPQQALNAYQQALDKKPLKPVILSYIKQRISILK